MKLRNLIIVGIFTLMSAQSAFAQTCENVEALKACEHIALESCRTESECEGDRAQGQTCQDLVEDTAERCCSKPTAKQRRECINVDLLKLTRGLAEVPRPVKQYLRTCRANIKELKTNACSTGSLGEL